MDENAEDDLGDVWTADAVSDGLAVSEQTFDHASDGRQSADPLAGCSPRGSVAKVDLEL
ncbi:hypothetical protein [Kitasatospora sp. NPDC017646]|uniref:hypothetical protein n=1 Tax=Kitasatospora sp. NPDC017646 TaxID=3364024 RepID=UPI0037A69D22